MPFSGVGFLIIGDLEAAVELAEAVGFNTELFAFLLSIVLLFSLKKKEWFLIKTHKIVVRGIYHYFTLDLGQRAQN